MTTRTPWILLGLAGASLLLVHTVLAAVAAGALWAILVWPLHRGLRKRLHPRIAAVAALASTGLLVLAPAFLLAPLMARELRSLGPIEDLWSSAPAWTLPLQAKAAGVVASLGSRLQGAATTALLQAPITAFVAYVGLRHGWRITLGGARLLPVPRPAAVQLLHRAAATTRRVALGQVLTALLKGAVGGVGLWVAGVPSPTLLAILMALFTLLPVLTAWMVWAPAALWLASQGHLVAAAFLTAWGALVVGMTDNLVRPVLIGRQARMPAIVALLGMAGGVATLGLAGLVIGPVLLDFTLGVHRAWRVRAPQPTPGSSSPPTTPAIALRRPPVSARGARPRLNHLATDRFTETRVVVHSPAGPVDS